MLRTINKWLFTRSYLNHILVCVTILFAVSVACTRYQPVGQGARVPWAEALLTGKAGPLANNRYRVGPGDNIGLIAERYGLRIDSLAAANNIVPPYYLYTGEVLRIPRTVESGKQPLALVPDSPVRQPSTITETVLSDTQPVQEAPEIPKAWEPRPRPQPRAQPVQPAPQPEKAERDVAGSRYQVKAGESLTVIARRHGLGLGELAAANRLQPPFRLNPGQALIIPPTESQRVQAPASVPPADIALQPPPPLSGEGFLWPVRGEVIGSFDENSGKGRSGGVNIAARAGASVVAAENGVVAYAGEALSGYGRMILIRHADGYVTLYAHNAVLLVREGQNVRRGQSIAEVGQSGDVNVNQLHFELRQGSDPIDPAKVLAGSPGLTG